MEKLANFLLRLYILQCIFLIMAFADKDEQRLLKDLIVDRPEEEEVPLARPLKNSNESVMVYLGLSLQQILDVDEKNQIVQTTVWLEYEWQDITLQWKPEEYGGVTEIRLPVAKVWRPDVLLYNSVDQKFDATFGANVILKHTGDIRWSPPAIIRSSCPIDITYFPFDDQVCWLKFGSWTYTERKLNLQIGSMQLDTSAFLPNGEWLLLSDRPPQRLKQDYMGEGYISLMFYLHIRRRTLYYGFNLIIPGLLISVMTVLGFTLPPECGEKITLEITILISICFLLNMVANMTPPTSDAIPLIGIFFSCCNMVVSASVVSTVIVLNLHHRTPNTHKMTPFVRSILLNWLPWMLMMKRPGYKFSRRMLKNPFKPQGRKLRHSESLIRNVVSWENDADRVHKMADDHRRLSVDLEQRVLQCLQPVIHNPSLIDPSVQAVLLVMQRIHSQLKFVTSKIEETDDEQQAETDWKFAAMVVDKLCLYLFGIFIVVSTLGIMLSAPHLVA